MRRRLVVSYLLLAAVVLAALEIPLGVVGARRERDAVRSDARRDATVLSVAAYRGVDRDHDDPHAVSELDELTRRYATGTRTEVVIVDAAGQVVAYRSSSERQQVPDVNEDRAPELAAALRGEPAVASRTAEGEPVEIAAEPIRGRDGRIAGAVQVAISARDAQHRIRFLVVTLAVFAAAVMALVALVGSVIARSVNRPLASLEAAVRSLEGGDLSARTRPEGPPETRELAAAFNAMADRLGELIASQRNFLADASHQLRSPLTALRLRLEAVDPHDPQAARHHLAGAIDEVGRLSRLVEGLLALVRVEGSRPQRARIDVHGVVRDRATMWEALAEERNVRLAVDAPPGEVGGLDVEGHLEQVLDNLLANALEVAPPGSEIVLSVAQAVEAGRPHVEVTVTDAGPGMTEEQRQTAFDRFWQGDSKPTGATGLGLPISRQLARASGGDLTLEAAPTGGLRAKVVLDSAT